jgi:aspartate-semialdehyde dehydrogenase
VNRRFKVAILGATGLVGQRFLQLLGRHPWFETATLAASEQSVGKRYAEAANWRLETPMPQAVRDRVIRQPLPDQVEADFVFSALDSAVAGSIEEEFARAGFPVVSNASPHRMAADVPLLLADVNPDHIDILPEQQRRRGYARGFLVTNPNCSTAGLVTALKPLDDAFGVGAASVVTMQAVSGAGYPGVASVDILDNVIPYIAKEEEKLQSEPLKILGRFGDDSFEPAAFVVSAQVNRVPVTDGHLESVSVKLRSKASLSDFAAALEEYVSDPQRAGLPTAPGRPVVVRGECDRPQPRLDRMESGGMAVVVGGIRPCPILDYRFTLLSHNTIRGAAGAAILNAEWLVEKGLLAPRWKASAAAARKENPLLAERR